MMRKSLCALALLTTTFASGCLYSFKAGSFPPPYIKTIAIEQFDNQTDRFEVTGELYQQLLKTLPGALGIRTAGADVADAIVKGTIERYSVAAPNYQAGQPGQPAQVLQRQVTISVKVQIIDQVHNVVLWEDSGVVGQGQFADANQSEDVGRAQAITALVQKIVDGAQSNW
jgi:Lipopolysaccharide-assembly